MHLSGVSGSSRRRDILEAALYCFVNRGYAATTIEEVRAASGASIGSIYHHFGSKEQLAGELYIEGLKLYQTGFTQSLKAALHARSGVRSMVTFHLDWVAENPDLSRFLLEEREPEVVLATAAPLRELNKAFFLDVRAWMDEEISNGPLKALPYDIFYATVMGPALEFTRNWLEGRTTSPLEEARDILADAAWEAVKA